PPPWPGEEDPVAVVVRPARHRPGPGLVLAGLHPPVRPRARHQVPKGPPRLGHPLPPPPPTNPPVDRGHHPHRAPAGPPPAPPPRSAGPRHRPPARAPLAPARTRRDFPRVRALLPPAASPRKSCTPDPAQGQPTRPSPALPGHKESRAAAPRRGL